MAITMIERCINVSRSIDRRCFYRSVIVLIDMKRDIIIIRRNIVRIKIMNETIWLELK